MLDFSETSVSKNTKWLTVFSCRLELLKQLFLNESPACAPSPAPVLLLLPLPADFTPHGWVSVQAAFEQVPGMKVCGCDEFDKLFGSQWGQAESFLDPSFYSTHHNLWENIWPVSRPLSSFSLNPSQFSPHNHFAWFTNYSFASTLYVLHFYL